MRIENHRLVEAAWHESPNQGGPFPTGAPDTLILHYTAGDTAAWAIDKLSDPTAGARVSAHLVVARDGGVTQLLPFDTIGWHAGRSSWGGRTAFNHFSLGIEIDNAGRLTPDGDGFVNWRGLPYDRADAVQAVHRHESEAAWWHSYPAEQLRVVEALSRLLVETYGLRWILGHEEIAPDRKDDPGPAFPLDELRQRLLPGPLADYPDAGPPPA
jgi:N-acetylmuramoyl-L-alanine amidase